MPQLVKSNIIHQQDHLLLMLLILVVILHRLQIVNMEFVQLRVVVLIEEVWIKNARVGVGLIKKFPELGSGFFL